MFIISFGERDKKFFYHNTTGDIDAHRLLFELCQNDHQWYGFGAWFTFRNQVESETQSLFKETTFLNTYLYNYHSQKLKFGKG